MSLAETYAMVHVVFEKEVALLRRYWLNTLSNVATTYVMFLLLFLGGQSVAPATLDDSLAGVIVGFFVWSLSWSAFQGPAQTITREASWGTLEQLYASPLPFRTVLSAEVFAGLLVNTITSGLLLLAMMVTTGRYLTLDLLTVVPLTVATVVPVVGLGLAAGGLALLYKRISQLFLLVQFCFLVAVAIRGRGLVRLLPLNLGTALLTRTMADGEPLSAMPVAELGLLVGKAVGFLVVGGVVFGYCLRVARRRGVLGHY
ncbi:ABC transporter permease [Halobaculum sp. MBLA0147]|uniref:ABC transporter permease n=1 Tax=Halobaculum sp. MBLA0147 TaxID=3079934 RepID=UPI003524FBD5